MKVSTILDLQGAGGIQGLINPTNAQDAANKAYVDANIEGIAWKDSVRAASDTAQDITLATPGATIGGVTMAANDRVLLRQQTPTSENGIWIFNGSSSLMTRALDMSVAAEFNGAVTTVEEGTQAGLSYRQQEVDVVVDTDAVVWTSFGTGASPASETSQGIVELATQGEVDAGSSGIFTVTPVTLNAWSGRKLKYAIGTMGNGALTSITITHNLNNRDVVVQFRDASHVALMAPEMTFNLNDIVTTWTFAPAANTKVVVIG